MKTKVYIINIITLLIVQLGYTQIHNPIIWRTSVDKISNTEYMLVANAKIKRGWHLYAQVIPKNGPAPTVFTFETNDTYQLKGNVIETGGKIVQDPVFNMKIKYFERKASFKQKIRILESSIENKGFSIKGEVEFMICDDTRCLPPKFIDLVFNIPAIKKIEEKDRIDVTKKEKKQVTSEQSISPLINNKAIIEEKKQIIASDKENISDITHDEVTNINLKKAEQYKVQNTGVKRVVPENIKTNKRGFLGIFFLAFGAGLTALLTPCVFPLIPMTVSFFTKQSKSKSASIKNAIIYGLSIIIIYVVLGTVVTAIFGANSLNAMATNIWFNIIFFFLLVIFAFSFLGAFEIMLPNSWANQVDYRANKGGYLGIFFMALALAIVSFSCTGPFVGNLIVIAASKGGIAPITGMLGFSLAIALPFMLFAAFPGWLNSLPKSGGWLNTVKVVLGFLELALAFKFLSQADLVLQLHLLEREVFLAIWIAIFGTLAFYLLGKIKLPHDVSITHISVGRLSLGLLVLSFTIYMIPGLWGAPLNLISAFPPPQEYSESPYGIGYTKMRNTSITDHTQLPDGGHLLAPHDILAFNDYDKGLAYAKKVRKPILIDFTGWACVNCRKMEQNVWPKQRVLDILKNDVVLISLYVDDKRPIPEGQQDISRLTPGKKLRYIGQKWSEMQQINYKANAQPFYVLMNHNEKNLIAPIAYTPNVDEYHSWLQKGVKSFRN